MPRRYMVSRGMTLSRWGWINVKRIGGDIRVGGEVQPGTSGRVVF